MSGSFDCYYFCGLESICYVLNIFWMMYFLIFAIIVFIFIERERCGKMIKEYVF